jgi:hypothetical protein
MHAPFLLQALDMPHVNKAPDASRLSGCKTNRVACFVQSLTNAVDPSKAESFVQSFCICDAFLSRPFPVETDQQLSRGVVISLKPLAKLFG